MYPWNSLQDICTCLDGLRFYNTLCLRAWMESREPKQQCHCQGYLLFYRRPFFLPSPTSVTTMHYIHSFFVCDANEYVHACAHTYRCYYIYINVHVHVHSGLASVWAHVCLCCQGLQEMLLQGVILSRTCSISFIVHSLYSLLICWDATKHTYRIDFCRVKLSDWCLW